jgi:hypothetical protein
MLSLHGTTSTDHKLSYARSVPGMLKIRRDGDKKNWRLGMMKFLN